MTDRLGGLRRRVRGVRPVDVVLVLLGGVLGGLGFAATWRGLIEDAYITLDYAANLGTRFEWGILPGIPANTATSPLNALLLGLLTSVTGSVMRALAVAAVLTAMVLTVGLLRLGRAWDVGRGLAWVGLPLLLVDPYLVGTMGMETTLGVTALVWLLGSAARGEPRAYGWLAGLTVLIRADLVVVVAVVWLLHPAVRRPLLRSTWATTWRAALVMLPWYAWSWVHFGSAIPDTLAIKQHAQVRPFWNGLWAFLGRLYPDAVTPALVLLVAGAVAAVLVPVLGRRPGRRPLLAPAVPPLAGLAYWGLFVALGVSPFTWYYGLPIAAATLTLSWAVLVLGRWVGSLGSRRQGAPGSRRLGPALVTAVLTLGLVAPSVGYWATRDQLPLTSAPAYANWATTSQYREIGQYLDRRFGGTDVGIHSHGEFGEIVYYCHCRIVDRFASRYILRTALARQRESSALMRLNYLFYDPADYPHVPQTWRLVFSRTEPPTTPRWPVATPSHGAGWISLVRLGGGRRPRPAP